MIAGTQPGQQTHQHYRPTWPGVFIAAEAGSSMPHRLRERVNSNSYPAGVTKTLLTQIAMPLQDPATLARDRVEYWKSRTRAGHALTAFAVSVLDNQAPATDKGDKDYPYDGQMLLTHCLLDGHNRMQAAAETASTVRILTLYAPFASKVSSHFDFATVFEILGAQIPP